MMKKKAKHDLSLFRPNAHAQDALEYRGLLPVCSSLVGAYAHAQDDQSKVGTSTQPTP